MALTQRISTAHIFSTAILSLSNTIRIKAPLQMEKQSNKSMTIVLK
jgi:hypothetical protein